MTRDPATTYTVFVSHATADKWVATTLCEKLEATAGVRTFRDDRDIAGGDDIPRAVINQIRRCDEMLVLFTPRSVERTWVKLEVGMALGHNKRIVSLLYHVDIDPIPTMLKARKAMPLNDADGYFAEVAARADKKLQRKQRRRLKAR